MIATAVARDPMTMPRRRCLIISISEQLTNDLSSLTKYERLVPPSVLRLLHHHLHSSPRANPIIPPRPRDLYALLRFSGPRVHPTGLFVIAQSRGIRIRIVVHVKRRLYTRGHFIARARAHAEISSRFSPIFISHLFVAQSDKVAHILHLKSY